MTESEVRRERKQALAGVRRAQRKLDTTIEVMERRLFALSKRKTILTVKDANDVVQLFDKISVNMGGFERSIADFAIIVSA